MQSMRSATKALDHRCSVVGSKRTDDGQHSTWWQRVWIDWSWCTTSGTDAVALHAHVVAAMHCNEPRRVPALPRTDTTACWFDGLLATCLSYLDGAALLSCVLVAKEWHDAASPRLGVVRYCVTWRHGRPLPAGLPPFSHAQLQRISDARSRVPLALSTRALWWVDKDAQTVHVLNASLQRSPSVASNVVAVRSTHALRPLGFSRTTLYYCEAAIRGSGSVGIWALGTAKPGSYAYHSDDGEVYWRDDGTTRQARCRYGPQWGYRRSVDIPAGDERVVVIGCGVDTMHGTLFFTKNGAFLGHVARVRVAVPLAGVAAAVVLQNVSDTAELNFGRAPFVFDMEAYIACGDDGTAGQALRQAA